MAIMVFSLYTNEKKVPGTAVRPLAVRKNVLYRSLGAFKLRIKVMFCKPLPGVGSATATPTVLGGRAHTLPSPQPSPRGRGERVFRRIIRSAFAFVPWFILAASVFAGRFLLLRACPQHVRRSGFVILFHRASLPGGQARRIRGSA